MGFFKFLSKKNKSELELDDVPLPTPAPSAPAVDNISQKDMSSVPGYNNPIPNQSSAKNFNNANNDFNHNINPGDNMMPEPPKPFDHGINPTHDVQNLQSFSSTAVAPPAPAPHEMQKPIMPDLPGNESVVPPVPSFAEQFGTHPNPKVVQKIEKSSNFDLDFKVPDLNINDQKLELEKHFNQISSDMNYSKNMQNLESPVIQKEIESAESTIPKMTIKPESYANVDNKIEEHLDDVFSFGSSFTQKRNKPSVQVVKKEIKTNPTLNVENKHEKQFENFIKNNLNKNQKLNLNNIEKTEEYHGPSHLDLGKPLFLSIDTCEKLSENLNDARALLKEKEIAFHALNDIDKTSESHYTLWKGIMESIQTQLFTIDKKLFR